MLALVAMFALAGWWYASEVGPLVLLLGPGLVAAGMLNPISSTVYFIAAFVVQAASYAALAIALHALLRRDRQGSKHAV